MSLPGLQSYHGDSEISDSEGESTPQHVQGVVISGLGIPHSNKVQSSPPSFVKPVIQPAPSIGPLAAAGLVDYHDEEEEGEGPHKAGNITREVVSREPTPLSEAPEEEPSTDVVHMVPSPSPELEMGEPLFLPIDGIELPPTPKETCSPQLQDKIIDLLQKKNKLGVTPYDVIARGKSFRNPSIYSRLIDLCKIDEFGTNYSKDVYDPHEWKEEDYYTKLSEAQKKAHEAKQKARAERSKIEFKSGTKQVPVISSNKLKSGGDSGSGLLPTPNTSIASVQEALLKKRRSKWDVSTGTGSKGSSPVIVERKAPATATSAPAASNVGANSVGAMALANAKMISKHDLDKLMKK